MPRTSKPTQCLAKFGVYGRISPQERELLDLATQFKQEIANTYHQEHRAKIDLRREYFPDLDAAVNAVYNIDREIRDCYREIRKSNSDQRTRSSVTEHRDTVKKLKSEKDRLRDLAYDLSDPFFKAGKDARQGKKQYCEKNKIRLQYVRLEDRPDLDNKIADTMEGATKAIFLVEAKFSLQRKQINSRYQGLGLNSGSRGEIAQSVEPKQGRQGQLIQGLPKLFPLRNPLGAVYNYSREPEVTPVNILTVQVQGGGCNLEEGSGNTLSFEKVGVNYKSSRTHTFYRVKHQVGTREQPLVLQYICKAHREFPEDCRIQRWSICYDRWGKRTVVPVVSSEKGFAKPLGEGVVAYDLGYRQVDGGWAVAYILGDNVHEDVVIPNWLCQRFISAKEEQAAIDKAAKELLSSVGVESKRQSFQQAIKLETNDSGYLNRLDNLKHREERRLRCWQRAIRCRDKIYETVVNRVRKSHNVLLPDSISLNKLREKYQAEDTRREMPDSVKYVMQSSAPGKLKALFDGSGLEIKEVSIAGESKICPECGHDHSGQPGMTSLHLTCEDCGHVWHRDYGACLERFARAGLPTTNLRASRNTDLVTTYINSLGSRYKKMQSHKRLERDCSQTCK